MPTNYTGVPTNTQAPSSQPAADVYPTVQIPAAGEAATAASVTQLAKVSADFHAYSQALLHGQLPKVVSDLPQILLKDLSGHERWMVDHSGLPGGPINVFREEWRVPFTANTTGAISVNPFWYMAAAGTPSSSGPEAAGTSTSAYGGNAMRLQILNTLNNKLTLSSQLQQMKLLASQSWSFWFDFAMDSNANPNGFTFWAGLSGSRDPSAPASGYAWFKKASTDTNWKCETNDGTTTNSQDSGVAPSTGYASIQRFKIEVHGASTYVGANTIRFFINDAIVATSTTNLPTAAQYIAFGGLCTTGSGAAHECFIGSVRAANNLFLSGGGI